MPQALATAIYRQVASVTARILAVSPIVESVLAHRSVATGEVSFGRSDIDLQIVVARADSEDGEKLASLYERVLLLRRFNPAVSHIAVHDPEGFRICAAMDTYWASMERRGALLLAGKPISVPPLPVERDHALGALGFWVEWFFSIAVQQRNRRNLRKMALEIWNTYATASGLIPEPFLRRSEAETHLRTTEKGIALDRLVGEPRCAAGFVFDLAERLHRRLLPALRSLSTPLVLEMETLPHWRRRTLVVLPKPGCPLPQEAFLERTFLCTPEALDLYMHYSNAFLCWTLPPQLLDIGMNPPRVDEFLRSCRYYAQSRFLRHPGFLDPLPSMPPAIMASLRHAVDWLSRGEVPPPLPRQQIQEIVARELSCPDYYRTVYPRLCQESQQIRHRLLQ